MSSPPAKRQRVSPPAEAALAPTTPIHPSPTADQMSTLSDRDCRAILLTLAQRSTDTAAYIASKISEQRFDFGHHVRSITYGFAFEGDTEDKCTDCESWKMCDHGAEPDVTFIVSDVLSAVSDMLYKVSQSGRADMRLAAIETMVAMGQEIIGAEEKKRWQVPGAPKTLIKGCKAVLTMMENRGEDAAQAREDVRGLWAELSDLEEFTEELEDEIEADKEDEEGSEGEENKVKAGDVAAGGKL